MDIEYDPEKAIANERKHGGVTFEEGASALIDAQAWVMEDGSADEARWVLLGLSQQGRLLVVVYTLRGETIRLISARKASKKEEQVYAR